MQVCPEWRAPFNLIGEGVVQRVGHIRSQTVAQLNETLTPTLVMVCSAIGASWLIATLTHEHTFWSFQFALTVTGFTRLCVHMWVRRAVIRRQDVSGIELPFQAAYLAFAVALGASAGYTILKGPPGAQLLMASLTVVYCGGAALLTGWHERLAYIAMTAAVLPSVVALVTRPEPFQQFTGAILFISLVAGVRSVARLQRILSEERSSRAIFQRLATVDPLTGIANRRGVFSWLREMQADGWSGSIAIHIFDLDRFKQVNDTFGHQAGDQFLALVAERLQQAVRGKDIVARWGGDEFLVLQPGISTLEQAQATAARITELIASPVELNGTECAISISVGSTVYQTSAEAGSIEAAIDQADRRLYEHKALAKPWVLEERAAT